MEPTEEQKARAQRIRETVERVIRESNYSCYICHKIATPNDPYSICQDCGREYCDACFGTPCHDLCSSADKQYHWHNENCPHRRELY